MSDTSWLRPAFFFHFNQIRHRNEGNHQVANPGFLEILPRILKLDRRLQQDIHQRERMVRNDETEHPRVLFLPEPPDSVLGRKLRPRDGPDRFVSEGDQRIPESPEVLRPQIGQEVGVLGVSRDSVEIHGHAAADQILYPVSIQPLKERLVIHVPTIIPESDGARKSDGPWTVERRQKTEDRRQKKHRKPENQMEAGMASAHIIGSRLLGHVHVYVHVGRFSSVSCLLSSVFFPFDGFQYKLYNTQQHGKSAGRPGPGLSGVREIFVGGRARVRDRQGEPVEVSAEEGPVAAGGPSENRPASQGAPRGGGGAEVPAGAGVAGGGGRAVSGPAPPAGGRRSPRSSYDSDPYPPSGVAEKIPAASDTVLGIFPLIVASTPDARLLGRICRAFQKHRLEAVLVGNAGAALQGAPVTTVDVDFLVRETPLNIKKIKAVAKELGAACSQPFLPASDIIRLSGPDLDIDFMFTMGGKTLEQIRSRSRRIEVESNISVMVASLSSIIDSKKKANRPKDRAALPILEATLKTIEAMESEQGRVDPPGKAC